MLTQVLQGNDVWSTESWNWVQKEKLLQAQATVSQEPQCDDVSSTGSGH